MPATPRTPPTIAVSTRTRSLAIEPPGGPAFSCGPRSPSTLLEKFVVSLSAFCDPILLLRRCGVRPTEAFMRTILCFHEIDECYSCADKQIGCSGLCCLFRGVG